MRIPLFLHPLQREDNVLRLQRCAWIVAALCLTGFAGCSNTQGTSPQVDKSTQVYRSGLDDNQNNGAGSGTTEKPASTGGSSWTDPSATNGATRDVYGTGERSSRGK